MIALYSAADHAIRKTLLSADATKILMVAKVKLYLIFSLLSLK